jgi:hypothetical protein
VAKAKAAKVKAVNAKTNNTQPEDTATRLASAEVRRTIGLVYEF